MEVVPGFLSIPRSVGFPRPAGDFFIARVVSSQGPGVWLVRIEEQTVLVRSTIGLQVGQNLKLRLAGQAENARIFQLVSDAQPSPSTPQTFALLAPAFLSRGLPLIAERLTLWNRWLSQSTGPRDREGWAASLESRGWGPVSPGADALAPWLAWQTALEEGKNEPPPSQEDFWDLWNAKPGHDPWLTMPLHWEWEGKKDAGLLQARWNPPQQAIDFWQVTAAPQGTPFRLEAQVRAHRLDLIWRFYQREDRDRWASWWKAQAPDSLSHPQLAVTLTVTGASEKGEATPWRNVDVQV